MVDKVFQGGSLENWYEVFLSDDELGTITLDSFDDFEEARAFETQYLKDNPDAMGKVWIDQWEAEDETSEPKFVRTVE